MTIRSSQANQRSDEDLELLSAYIDNQLSAAERANLEKRLRADPALRAELEELRTTALVLRDLPPLPPPRSFTLDPAMVKQRRAWFQGWVGRFGGALAALAVMFVLGLSLLRSGTGGMAMAPAAQVQATTVAAAPTAAAAAAAAPEAARESAPVPTAAPAAMSAPASAPMMQGAAASPVPATPQSTADMQAPAPLATQPPGVTTAPAAPPALSTVTENSAAPTSIAGYEPESRPTTAPAGGAAPKAQAPLPTAMADNPAPQDSAPGNPMFPIVIGIVVGVLGVALGILLGRSQRRRR